MTEYYPICLACRGMPYRTHDDNCDLAKSYRRSLEQHVWNIHRVLENETTITGVTGEIPWSILNKLFRDYLSEYDTAKKLGAVQ